LMGADLKDWGVFGEVDGRRNDAAYLAFYALKLSQGQIVSGDGDDGVLEAFGNASA